MDQSNFGNKNLKFLIINNYSKFASKDVWDGLCAAFNYDLHIPVIAYPLDMVAGIFSHDMLENHIISTTIRQRNEFSHVILINALFLTDDAILSMKGAGPKIVYWSVEDPHQFDQNKRMLDLCDYYFTNEKAVAAKFEKAFYVPTAGSHMICRPPSCKLSELGDEGFPFKNEVVFCGNVYPNRRKILEELIPYFEKYKISLGIMGITSHMKDDGKSPLRNYIVPGMEGIVRHNFIIMAYGYAKFVINIERDSNYEYNEKISTNRKFNIKGESLNPRAYEVALTGGGLQLIDKKRAELFVSGILEPGKHCIVYDSAADLVDKILYFRENEDERRKIVAAAREHALKNHTYISRAQRMLDYFSLKEERKKDLAKSVIARLKNSVETKNGRR